MNEAEWFKAARTGEIKILRKYIYNGQQLDIHNVVGWTALMIAAFRGHHQCVKLLLQYNASTDIQDEDGWTALMYAACKGYVQCSELLLKAGANPFELTKFRCSPKIQPVLNDFESQLEKQLLKAYIYDGSAGLDFILIPDLAKCIVRFIIPKLHYG